MFAPEILAFRVRTPSTVFHSILAVPRPRIIPLIERLPSVALIRNRSILLVRNISGMVSVVPIKFVVATVPLLPVIDQLANAPLAPDRFCQLAIPVASETSTFPFPGLHHWIRMSPLISILVVGSGVEVLIPIFPDQLIRIRSTLFVVKVI